MRALRRAGGTDSDPPRFGPGATWHLAVTSDSVVGDLKAARPSRMPESGPALGLRQPKGRGFFGGLATGFCRTMRLRLSRRLARHIPFRSHPRPRRPAAIGAIVALEHGTPSPNRHVTASEEEEQSG